MHESPRVWFAMLCLAVLTPGAPCAAETDWQFVRHQGGKLYVAQEEFRFVSWNVPNLLVLEDAFSFLGASPWRWPDEFELTDALESVKQMGGTVVRPYVITVRRDDGDMGNHVHVLSPGVFNEEAFVVLDRALAIAREKGVRVIIPLVDNWRWHGGIEQYAAFRGKKAGQFWTDPQLMRDYLRTVEYIVNRRNTITGTPYRDDPTILGWETGNELDAPPEWTKKVAAYIKSIDTNHLVIDGRSLKGIAPESLVDPNIDVVTTHHYPNTGNNNAKSVLDQAQKVGRKKAYFVGEFGFLGVPEAQRILDAVVEGGVSGALYWSLRYHRREGGFYWHHEPSGGDLFKAYHWPGFHSGREYREHLVIPMVREAAFRIRNLPTPALPTPAPPKLLPIKDVARISWQGSTGAKAYDLQRSTSETGPWKTIASNVSDAAVQYRPLFCDNSAEVGQAYWYRVAAKNSSGRSGESNVIGPIRVRSKTLVDEYRGTDKLNNLRGPHELRTNNARNVQEDIHRLWMGDQASIQYTTPEDMHSVSLWYFAPNPDARVQVTAFRDNDDVGATIECVVRTGRTNAGDYGYLTPILAKATPLPPGVRRVQLSTTANEVQLSRAEIKYSATQPTNEPAP